jgi:hypothetical protein
MVREIPALGYEWMLVASSTFPMRYHPQVIQ